MSAGRIPWEARSFRFTDPTTGHRLDVMATTHAEWGWDWEVSKAHVSIAKGIAKTSSAAKGAARKALIAAQVKK